jgi:hypothetical protein
MQMHGLPGGIEMIIISFFGCFLYLLPLAFSVFVIVYLVKIKTTLDKIEKRLDQLEASGQEPTPQI